MKDEIWKDLRRARIFLTGGTGFFGCWLLKKFLEVNQQFNLQAAVVVLTRNPARFRSRRPHLAANPAVRLQEGDIRSFDFPKGDFSHMIHAAAETSLSLLSEKPRLGFDVIVEGTKRALEFAKASGLRQFLLTSSGAVYGRQPDKMTHIPEEYLGAPDPTSQLSAYGKGKRAAESLCATYSQEGSLQAKIARGFAFVGPYMDVDAYYAIGNFIRDALKGGPIQVRGDGTAYRSYMYGADLAEWLWIILLKGKVCYPYNVGSENRISIKELAETVRDTVNPKAEIHISVKSAPGRAPEQYVPSTRRARAELGLNETVDLRKAIQLTAESLTENHFQKT